MNPQEPQSVNFLQENLVLVGVVAVVIFGYLLLLIRKRWKRGFKHNNAGKPESTK